MLIISLQFHDMIFKSIILDFRDVFKYVHDEFIIASRALKYFSGESNFLIMAKIIVVEIFGFVLEFMVTSG